MTTYTTDDVYPEGGGYNTGDICECSNPSYPISSWVYTERGWVPNGAPVWDDLRFPAQGINPSGQAAAPSVDRTAFPGTLLFSNTVANLIAGVAQMPHAWNRGTEIHPHLHWSKTTNAAGGVVWEWCYSIADVGGTFGAYSAWLPAESKVPDSNTASKQALDVFPWLDMTGYKESTMICWQVRRNPDATGDTYADAVRLFEFDFHYQSNKLGTVREIPV